MERKGKELPTRSKFAADRAASAAAAAKKRGAHRKNPVKKRKRSNNNKAAKQKFIGQGRVLGTGERVGRKMATRKKISNTHKFACRGRRIDGEDDELDAGVIAGHTVGALDAAGIAEEDFVCTGKNMTAEAVIVMTRKGSSASEVLREHVKIRAKAATGMSRGGRRWVETRI